MEIGQKITIECVESHEGCTKCVFSKDRDLFGPNPEKDCRIKCTGYERQDNKSVIFIEVKE